MTFTTLGSLPREFIASHAELDAEEVAFGVTTGLLDPKDAIALAEARFVRGFRDAATVAFAMILSEDADEVVDLARRTASLTTRDARPIWAYLIVAWAVENTARTACDAIIEELFAEFDYPTYIAALVSWMPLGPRAEPGWEALEARRLNWLAEGERADRTRQSGNELT